MTASEPHRPSVDLGALQRDATTSRKKKRRGMSSLLVWLIVLGILGAAYVALKPLFFPPKQVRFARAIRLDAAQASASPTRGTFIDAPGWIEADPYPVTVRPFVSGVVDTLHVLEGTRVVKGETLLATLRNPDLENAVDVSKAKAATAREHVEVATVELSVAKSLLEQRLPLRERLASLKGDVSTALAAIATAKSRQRENERAVTTAEVDVRAQRTLVERGKGAPVALARAEARVSEVKERAEALRHQADRAQADLDRTNALIVLAKEALNDPRALQGEVDRRGATVKERGVELSQALVDVRVAERNAALLHVKAPMDGVVLRLECAPGAVVGPRGEFKGEAEAGSSGGLNRMTGTICLIYDETSMQARVDVPLAEVSAVDVGTKTKLKVRAVPTRAFEGVVTRRVHEADINKNTLQVKVRVDDPGGLLRPEMLCSARFEIPAAPRDTGGTLSASEASEERAMLFRVPKEAVRDGALFVFDPRQGGRARKVPVTVVHQDDVVAHVRGSLSRTSQVILDAVAEGESVRGVPIQ